MAVKSKYRDIVRKATLAAGAIGVPGAFSFGADVAAMTGIWGTMIVSIANRSGHRVDKTFATKLAAGVLAGVSGYVGGSKVAMKMLHLIPGAGSLAAIGVNSTLNAIFTYKLGRAISELFDKGDFSTSDIQYLLTTTLTLVACIPSFEEIADIFSMVSQA